METKLCTTHQFCFLSTTKTSNNSKGKTRFLSFTHNSVPTTVLPHHVFPSFGIAPSSQYPSVFTFPPIIFHVSFFTSPILISSLPLLYSTIVPFFFHHPYLATLIFFCRKRHIGNDIVVIVFIDGDTLYRPTTISSRQVHVVLVVKATTIPSDPGQRYYRLAVVSKDGTPRFRFFSSFPSWPCLPAPYFPHPLCTSTLLSLAIYLTPFTLASPFTLQTPHHSS